MKKKFLLLSAFVMVIGWVVVSQPVVAQEGNGGQVQTNGEITFYEDEPVPSSSSEPPASSSEEPPVSSSVEPVPDSSTPTTPSSAPATKPPGKFPSTGELVKTSLSISGGILLGIALLFFILKRRKKGGAQE